MKKKGFTLIELLAVIVILAIIALIATPLVLKYIEKSRKESKVDSAYSFVRNLETEIANFSIKHNGKKYTTNKVNIKELGLNITVKGENPDDGKVCISSVGQIEKGVFQYGKYYVSYDGKKGSISDKDTYDNFSCSGNVSKIEVPEATKNLTYQDSGYNLTFFNDMIILKSDFSEAPVEGQNINALLTFNDKTTQEIILDGGKSYWHWEQNLNGFEVDLTFNESHLDSNYYNIYIDTNDEDGAGFFTDLYSVTLLGKEIRHYIMNLGVYTSDDVIFNNPKDLNGKRIIVTFDDNTQNEYILSECLNAEEYDFGSVRNYTDDKKNYSADEVIYYYAENAGMAFGIYTDDKEIKTITTDDNGVMTTYNVIK